MFLALGLGILMGSVVLSDRYVERLENRVKGIEGQLDERREDIVLLNERLDVLQDFSVEAQTRLLDRALIGQEVVAIELPRTDGRLRDTLIDAIEGGDGALASTIRLTERFTLEDEQARSDLASILRSQSSDPELLRSAAASSFGQKAAAAAERLASGRGGFGGSRFEAFIEELQAADFVDVTSDDEPLVPPGAVFMILGGAPDEATEGVVDLATELATALAGRGSAVVVTETSDSVWDLVQAVRDDADAGAAVTTVEAGESVPGRIAVVLGLQRTIDGVTGHYGNGEGATAIVPPPTPED